MKSRSCIAFSMFFAQLIVLFVVFSIGFISYANWQAIEQAVRYQVNTEQRADIDAQYVSLEPNRLVIPKISVNAPVQWDIEFDHIEQSLSRGTVHFAESALPGEDGATVLFGHSSDYAWKHNPYAAVFALLPKLEPNDAIVLRRARAEYHYTVTQKLVVDPEAIEVASIHNGSDLTLITCYPVGTTKMRLVIHAALTEPPGQRS